MVAVLRVALDERGERIGGVGGIEDRDLAEGLDPGQPRPVLLVVVDGERGSGPGAQPATRASRSAGTALGLWSTALTSASALSA